MRRYTGRQKRKSRAFRINFLIVTEGQNTEPDYFSCIRALAEFCPDHVNLIVRTPHGNRSDPKSILQKMKAEYGSRIIDKRDQAWIVIDRDQHDQKALRDLITWEREDEKNHLAMSNPRFELWLLWHFEESLNIDGLSRYGLIDDKKHIPSCHHITQASVNLAIERAKRYYYQALSTTGQPVFPPENTSTVFRLLEALTRAASKQL